MSKGKQKRPKQEKRIDETSYLSGRRRGAILKEEVWFEGDRLARYSLAYIDSRVYGGDNGRVLAYDNAHGLHHRHFMGKIQSFEFRGYEELVSRFEDEVRELWRIEDEQESKS